MEACACDCTPVTTRPAISRFPENIHKYTSRAEQSSINAIFEGVQTQSENEEAWNCAINTSETAPKIDTSPPHQNKLFFLI